jgi:phospholipid-binding lipoprotein MlaA
MPTKLIKILLCCVLALLATGCATQANKDPLEGLNRGVYKFNDVADKVVLKPVATVYKTVAPSPIRKGFNNFFNNLGSITTVLNDLLQLKFADAFTDSGRFIINSTFGLAGFIDVASMDKIPVHKEDFGQTLGHWGVGNGPYLVLPILGSSSVRDTTGFVFDSATSDPLSYVHNIGEIRLHNQLRAGQIVDKRTELLDAKDIVDNASLDPYAFTRDAYLQRRASDVQDGLVPKELLNDDDGFEPADEDVETPDKAAATDNSAANAEPASAAPVDASPVIEPPSADAVTEDMIEAAPQ